MAALVLGVVNFGKPVQISVGPTPVQINVPEQEAPIVNVQTPETVVNVPSSKLGAVSGPDFFGDYFAVNDVRTFYNSKGLNQATTTVCSIKSPNATSSLVFGAIRFDVASTSATFVEIARATTAFATTTLIGTGYNIAAGAQATIVASTTPTGGDAIIFPPNNFLNVKVAWATAATSASVPRGVCKANFTAI